MSQHAIEDLIEDTVHLIDAATLPDAAKRDYLAALYGIQYYYDTSYTHFRVMHILLNHGFVYRLPLDTYPAHTTKKVTIPGWLEDETTGELARIEQEEDGTFIYVDAGSTSWKILCEKGLLPGDACNAVTPIPITRLVYHLAQEAEKQAQQTLLTQWYGLLVNGYLQGTLGEAEGLSSNLYDLITHKDLLQLRTIAQRNNVKRNRNIDEDLRLPVLSEEAKMADTPDKEYAARFLLDLKKTPDAIKAAYEKAAKARLANAGVIDQLINGQLNTSLSQAGWSAITGAEKKQWSWYKDEPAGRRFIWVVYEAQDKMLMCHLGMQHRLLLNWQQRQADTVLAHLHFTQMTIASLPQDRQEDKKFMHDYGGWKFDIAKPAKTLQSQIDRLIEDIGIAENTYFTWLNKEFPEAFFNRNPERLVHLAEEGEDDTGIVPDYTLFNSFYSIQLSFIYHYHTQGNAAEANTLISNIRERLNNKQRKSAYETKCLEPFLQQYEKNASATPMPLLHHHLLLQALREEE